MTRIPFNAKSPIESFDPRFRNIWLRAALEPISLTFTSPREAAAFQARLQNFRANLRKSNDPSANAMYKARTSRLANVLTISPADLKFNSILEQFDNPSSLSSTTLEATIDAPFTREINIDDLFAEFNTETNAND